MKSNFTDEKKEIQFMLDASVIIFPFVLRNTLKLYMI